MDKINKLRTVHLSLEPGCRVSRTFSSVKARWGRDGGLGGKGNPLPRWRRPKGGPGGPSLFAAKRKRRSRHSSPTPPTSRPQRAFIFLNVLLWKKGMTRAAEQRRPAKTRRKNRIFFRKTTGRMVWDAQRSSLKMLYQGKRLGSAAIAHSRHAAYMGDPRHISPSTLRPRWAQPSRPHEKNFFRLLFHYLARIFNFHTEISSPC